MSSISNVENLSPQIIRHVSKELGDLTKSPPEGIKVFLNEEDITDVQASIEGPAGTPYAGGLFRMKLVLSKNFPSEPPKAFFLTKIFHPNVASNGEICVNTLKKDWKAELGIKHILLTIKCLLIVPNPESALNEEAGKLLLEQYDDYSSRAKMFTEIHAKPLKAGKEIGLTKDIVSEGPMAKKHAGDKKLLDKKKKEKKKVLKRL
ncbi:ubiquitin-conjugating enzyme E2 S [Patella vulgata]|uniref:E2 ubiquitin-conjugating enzyme n=1 Tax=Patella caerulea TaxID=87958 RepID=A0AAN8GHM7_PATCE|nr:ubiquitin-conjugating enzyme E2 S [Patella vulgata]